MRVENELDIDKLKGDWVRELRRVFVIKDWRCENN